MMHEMFMLQNARIPVLNLQQGTADGLGPLFFGRDSLVDRNLRLATQPWLTLSIRSSIS
jgi:hypothetical protein